MDDSTRRAEAGATGTRLTAALLGYFGLVIVVITLSPFDFAWPRQVRASYLLDAGDIVANVAMFLPVGFLLHGFSSGRRGWSSSAVPRAAAFSLLVEIAQVFLRGRYASPVDVVINTVGAYLGVALRDRLERRAVWQPGLIARLGLHMPLVGLAGLLVPQMWLSGVGMVDDPRRGVTMLLLGAAGSVLLVALYRHRWNRDLPFGTSVVPLLALLWFTVGALPPLADSPGALATMVTAIVLLTWGLVRSPAGAGERRFEIGALRRFLPVFCLYLIVAALWPPFRAVVPWHGALGFSDRLHNAGVVDLLLLLEIVCGFTLLGYAVAEWRGRRELSLADDVPCVAVGAAVFAALLELVQGRLAGPGASGVRWALATGGAIYGVAVYHLARAHVRAHVREMSGERHPAAIAAFDDAA